MPLIRKLVQIGNSKAVTIPKTWLDYIEKQTGKKITELAVEVNGVLKIFPTSFKDIKEKT